jgi:hypothetical protein
MREANQPKLTEPSSLGEADFDCKYHEHVSLINLALFILNNFFWDRYSIAHTLINA